MFKRDQMASRAFLLIFCAASLAWVRPQIPATTKAASDFTKQLQYVNIEVNGVLQTVRNGDTLRIVRGDRLKVVSGVLKDPSKRIDALNVIGFDHKSSRGNDDRGVEFSSFALLDRWSENKDGKTWALIATSGKETNGHVFISVIEPELNFAVLDVNGSEVILRAGELFKGKPEDKVRVKRVATNVADNDNVFVQMVPVQGRTGEFEMRFLREKMVFARLPIKLEK